MGRVYRVGGVNHTVYLPTRREADRYRIDGCLPETFHVLDAAEECMKLQSEIDDRDREIIKFRNLLADLYDVACGHCRASPSGCRAAAEITKFDPSAIG